MKGFLHTLVLTATLGAPFCATALPTASAMPDIYLAGKFADGSDWVFDRPGYPYRFECEGNSYTISLPAMDGEFKIASIGWSPVDIGAPFGKETVAGAGTYSTLAKGANFKATGLTNVTISLTLDSPEDTEVTLTVTCDQTGPGSVPGPGVSGTLPVLYINTDPVMLDRNLADKKYRDGVYWLDALGIDGYESVGSAEEPLPLEIKARGNYTRTGFSKKPFKLKLGSKESLLGLSKSKHYAILAHADDNRGYMKNYVGFTLGQRIGLPWTPTEVPVEVVMNGNYRGVYFLTESIRVEKDRINITELDDNAEDPALCSGGYLVELDNYLEENTIEISPSVWVTPDTPEEYSDIQRRFVTDQFTTMDGLVGSHSDELWSYMDLDMAARYYIVMELIDHWESYHGSTYLYRDFGEGQKWVFSPLWDCGNAFGRRDCGSYFTDVAIFGNTWIADLRQNGRFMDKVKETWRWFGADPLEGLETEIAGYASRLAAAARSDRERWRDEPLPDSTGANAPTPVCDNTDMEGARAFVTDCLSVKRNWLNSVWCMPEPGAGEPEADTTPAAKLPDYVNPGSGITGALLSAETEAGQCFTIDGLRVDDPTRLPSGTIVIVRNGLKVNKHIIK